jgi:hypothetical protein
MEQFSGSKATIAHIIKYISSYYDFRDLEIL